MPPKRKAVDEDATDSKAIHLDPETIQSIVKQVSTVVFSALGLEEKSGPSQNIMDNNVLPSSESNKSSQSFSGMPLENCIITNVQVQDTPLQPAGHSLETSNVNSDILSSTVLNASNVVNPLQSNFQIPCATFTPMANASNITPPLPTSLPMVNSSNFDTLNSTLASLLGKKNVSTFSPSVGVIDRGVNDELRQCIVNDQYVNFADLIVPLTPIKNPTRFKNRMIQTFDQWQKAFNVFVTIYTSKFPDAMSALMEYSNVILDLYLRNPGSVGWRQYDEVFRFHRQSDKRSFAIIDNTLWLQVATPRIRQKYGRIQTENKNGDIFKKCAKENICFRFQIDRCTFKDSCKYKHICRECKGKHPFSKCSNSNSIKGGSHALADTS